MVIIYGTRTVFKREGPVGTSVCPNCRHNVQKQRGIMCESCGMITPVSTQEYRERKQVAKMYY